MLIRKHNIWFKPVGVCLAVLTSLSPAWAGDMMYEAKALPETQYETSLLKDSSLYPNVTLRKQVSQNCYCSGAYFSVGGGYAWGNTGKLVKGHPVVVATGDDAPGQPVIANPGLFNEYIPEISMSSDQIIGTAAMGYKFGNFRVEVSGEYRRHNTLGGATGLNAVELQYSARSQQYAGLMSAFYDVETPGIPIQPYIGLGAGIAFSNTVFGVDYFKAGNVTSASVEFSKGMGFIGAAMAGVAINIGDNFTVDVGYRFTDTFGGRATYEGQTNGAAINGATGVNLVNISGMALATDSEDVVYQETLDYPDIISHEVRAGVRFRF